MPKAPINYTDGIEEYKEVDDFESSWSWIHTEGDHIEDWEDFEAL